MKPGMRVLDVGAGRGPYRHLVQECPLRGVRRPKAHHSRGEGCVSRHSSRSIPRTGRSEPCQDSGDHAITTTVSTVLFVVCRLPWAWDRSDRFCEPHGTTWIASHGTTRRALPVGRRFARSIVESGSSTRRSGGHGIQEVSLGWSSRTWPMIGSTCRLVKPLYSSLVESARSLAQRKVRRHSSSHSARVRPESRTGEPAASRSPASSAFASRRSLGGTVEADPLT